MKARPLAISPSDGAAQDETAPTSSQLQSSPRMGRAVTAATEEAEEAGEEEWRKKLSRWTCGDMARSCGRGGDDEAREVTFMTPEARSAWSSTRILLYYY